MNIGLISAATYKYGDAPARNGSNHGTAFASTFNGFDEAEVKKHEWTFVRAQETIEGAKVTKVWDRDKFWAERLAKACSIPTVADTPEECADGVDVVIIVDDGSGEQSKYAAHPLKNGIPVFCDKPLAMTGRKAKAVADLAKQTGTPFMSSSSLRFVPDILNLKEQVSEIGPVRLAQTICGNELVYYGIHALSMAYAVFGGGAVSAVNVGQPGMNIVRIRFDDHRDVVLMVGEREWMRAGYQISLFGQKAWATVKPDLKNLYWYLLKEFMNYVKTGKEPYPIDQEVELIAALEAGKISLKENREVEIAEVLGG
ncbi:MAG: Gfo/Idh/MocA family oxidoreductase [Verrucomicrobiales bacterium]|nr:Gfo/Idh/MocA family oxidoreductase [Verrucomicrobiales bacterium]